MANPSKKNNQKRSKPADATRPETARRAAQAAATSPVAGEPLAVAVVQGKAQPPPTQGKTPSQTQKQPRTENPNRSPSQEQIAKRAYQIFQARGGAHGRHDEDWKQAEQELKLGMH
jgi:Protein of unknown function (DUF2934)